MTLRAAALFLAGFGTDSGCVASAPGRVNLIGEHTDYNGGLVLPFAIDARAQVAVGPGGTRGFRVASGQRPGSVLHAADADLVPGSPAARGWGGYPFGVLWSLRAAGHAIPPLDLALDSSVPSGAGLSSSAAMECAVALAVSQYLGLEVELDELARLAQRAENDFVGVPCGLMDQMAAACCRAGLALYFDVGAGTTEQIPFDPATDGLRLLVIDTRAHHALADGEYARRRAECEMAADALGVATLRGVPPGDLDGALRRLGDDIPRRRVRHVVTENQRVRQVVALLRAGRQHEIGPQLTASHASLRDDYQVSAPELDTAVDAALGAGALGARMVGGGFGGSAIALAPTTAVQDVRAEVRARFQSAGFRAPVIRAVSPADGARLDG